MTKKEASEAIDDPINFYNRPQTEKDLLMGIIFGMTEKEYKKKNHIKSTESIREAFDIPEFLTYKNLRFMNASLLLIGMSYEDRMKHLQKYFKKMRMIVD